MSRHWIYRGLVAFVACCTAIPNSVAVSSQLPKKSAPATTGSKATTQELGGPERYLTMISTDKPMYRAGEKVYARGVLLNAANHKPLPASQGTGATVEIKGPKGDVVATGSADVQDSVWAFAWEVPEGQAGGEYTMHISYPWAGHAPAERKFDIRAYRAPRLKSQITFLRDGYGPGEKVNATLDVKRAEGGVPEGAKVTVGGVVDGMAIKGAPATVDAAGLCHVSLDLPHDIPRGEGTLALTIEDGGVVETASKTIPILLQTVDLQIFPEGGDLVAGFSNRVYIQAKQPNGKPADLACKLMTKSGELVTSFRTEHEGRGRFHFTPAAGKEYYLAVSEPAGIKTTYPLPQVKNTGAVIQSDIEVVGKGEPLAVHVGSTDRGGRVSVSLREVEVASAKIDGGRNGENAPLQAVSLPLPENTDGVLTVTVWSPKNVPLAERLVFRRPANPLTITVKAEKKSYVPGDNAKLTVKATDSHGKPVSAVVGVTVTDDSVLEMVEKREQAPRLPVMYYIEPEVKDLADAHVYLDYNNPKAPLATDLLLGTQGWRRFNLMNLEKFVEQYGDDARRATAMKLMVRNEMMLAQRQAGAGGAMGGAPMGIAFAANAGMMPMKEGAKHLNFLPPAPPPMVPQEIEKAPRDKDQIAQNMPVPAAKHMPMAMDAMGKIMAAPVLQAQNKMEVAASRAMEKKRRAAFIADEELAAVNNLIAVREFAHQVRKGRKATDRVDFAETLYWNAGVKTDARTGEASVAFGLNDSVSTFRVFADGFSGDGAIGSGSTGVESVQPFYAEAKMPLEVTAGDKILLPISLVNATTNQLTAASLKVDLAGDSKLKELLHAQNELAGGARVRCLQTINVGTGNGLKNFVLTAHAGAFEDKMTRQLSIKPQGFPIESTFGGILEPGKAAVHTVTIPSGIAAGSLVSEAAVYPTPLANMTGALERMIQDPYGCFEQTSSTSYPLTMAQQYFLSHTGVDPKLVSASRQKLDAGYKRLVGFWCPDKGYEWFGENPGHEALTAFGLLHFSDMAKVRDVDQNMIASTRAWLLKQKDGQGGFTRKRRSLHTWLEDKDASNAYIEWALLESGEKADELKPELAALKTAADASQNSYVVALAANALYLGGDKAAATKLMDRLAAKQKADGSVDGIKSSIVGSEGESLAVEGTSLATLAWLREPAYAGHVERSIKFLADNCQSGRYGSTQATVLALRAIVQYDKQRAHPKAPGRVRLYVDGQSIGDWVPFTQTTTGAIKMPDASELLTPGDHKLEIRMEDGGAMPYSLAVKYNAVTPATDKSCKLDLAVKLAQTKLVEGNATEADVTVTNKTGAVVPNPVAIVGLPGGMEPRHDQLKELVKKGKIDCYEVRGREVVLYWRALPADAKIEVPVSLIAAIPGNYTGPASRAYLYYTDEHKRWIDGVHVEIAAK